MLAFTYSVERPQAWSPSASTGYTDWAKAVLPLGRFMRAASQTNALEVAQATSRVCWHRKRQVKVPDCLGRESGLVTSAAVRIITVESLLAARSRRLRCSLVSTSLALSNSPEPTTMWSQGTVMAYSMSPYSR